MASFPPKIYGDQTNATQNLIKQTGIDLANIVTAHCSRKNVTDFQITPEPRSEQDESDIKLNAGSEFPQRDDDVWKNEGGENSQTGFIGSRTFQCKIRTTWTAVILGQILSVILCISAVTSVYLVDEYDLKISNAQNFVFYILLSAIFTTTLACRSEDKNLLSVLKSRGWKYALVALADAEGNFLVVKAYQYTTLTSVQLLDCFTIPTVLALSWALLRIRYKLVHFLGVVICLLGVGCLVLADIDNGIPFGLGKQRLLGDILCLSGAFLYGCSNVAQEFLVKTFDIVEFLGMVGLFGSVVTGIQTIALEFDEVKIAVLTGSPVPIALLVGFALAQLSFYVVAGVVMKLAGATVYNLSILTADFYSLIVGIYLFQYRFQTLYFVSFALVVAGVSIFSIKPTTTSPAFYTSI